MINDAGYPPGARRHGAERAAIEWLRKLQTVPPTVTPEVATARREVARLRAEVPRPIRGVGELERRVEVHR
jgi:hypothetical protein